MLLGRVIGTVVPAMLVDELSATPLLWVQPLDREGQANGDPLVCADGTRMAGPGQMIYWVASREAALTLIRGLSQSMMPLSAWLMRSRTIPLRNLTDDTCAHHR